MNATTLLFKRTALKRATLIYQLLKMAKAKIGLSKNTLPVRLSACICTSRAIPVYIALSIMIILMLTPMHLANAKTIDNLSVGDKDEQVFINTDQLMTKDGSVIKNLDVVQEAFNTSSATDNIKVCMQSNTAICKLRLRERMPAVMNFNEDVKSFVLGDGLNFAFSSVDGSRKIYKLEGYYPGADTNLTIVGESGLIYSFYVRIDSVSSKFVSDFVVNVNRSPILMLSARAALKNQEQRARDITNPLNLYANKFSNNATVNSPSVNNPSLHNTSINNAASPSINNANLNNAAVNNTSIKVNQAQHRQSPQTHATQEELEQTAQQRVRTTPESQYSKPSLDYLDSKPSVTIQDLDFNFEIISGDKTLMPKSVFDDGIWTYWQYGNNNLDAVDKLPVPYAVVDGYDMPLNSRIEGGYLITEGISKRWTLRSGESYACVSKFE